MPDTLQYRAIALQTTDNTTFAAQCYASYVPEGYTTVKLHCELDNVTVSKLLIKTWSTNYNGTDYGDKVYTTSKGDAIEFYLEGISNSNLNSVAQIKLYITLYK